MVSASYKKKFRDCAALYGAGSGYFLAATGGAGRGALPGEDSAVGLADFRDRLQHVGLDLLGSVIADFGVQRSTNKGCVTVATCPASDVFPVPGVTVFQELYFVSIGYDLFTVDINRCASLRDARAVSPDLNRDLHCVFSFRFGVGLSAGSGYFYSATGGAAGSK
jgi:hypothetical protein